MTDPVDQFFERAREDVPTLAAPPGRFDELQTVSRRRRNRNTTMVSAAAAVVLAVAGGGAVIGAQNLGRTSTNAAAPAAPSPDKPTTVAAPPSAGASSAALVNTAVPAGFGAWSVTFIGQTSWVIGGYPCGSTECTAVIQSSHYPYPWSTVYQPSASIGQSLGLTGGTATIRMANMNDGWIVDSSQVLSTHDGGTTWAPVADLAGAHITALEDWHQQTYALGRDGSSIWISTSTSADSWHQQAGLSLPSAGPGTVDTLIPDSLAVAAVRTQGQHVSVSLSRNDGVDWAPVTLPCTSSGSQPAPVFALLDANSAEVVCGNGDLYRVPTNGATPSRQGTAKLVPGAAKTMAGVSVSTNKVATFVAYAGSGIYGVVDTKAQARATRVLKGDFSYVGLTDNEHGIALTSTPSGSFKVTFDGGLDWTTQSFG
jgi:hypothetical protein